MSSINSQKLELASPTWNVPTTSQKTKNLYTLASILWKLIFNISGEQKYSKYVSGSILPWTSFVANYPVNEM